MSHRRCAFDHLVANRVRERESTAASDGEPNEERGADSPDPPAGTDRSGQELVAQRPGVQWKESAKGCSRRIREARIGSQDRLEVMSFDTHAAALCSAKVAH